MSALSCTLSVDPNVISDLLSRTVKGRHDATTLLLVRRVRSVTRNIRGTRRILSRLEVIVIRVASIRVACVIVRQVLRNLRVLPMPTLGNLQHVLQRNPIPIRLRSDIRGRLDELRARYRVNCEDCFHNGTSRGVHVHRGHVPRVELIL